MKKLFTRNYFFYCLLLFLPLSFYSQLVPGQQSENKDGLVKWLTFKEAQEMNKQQPKPFLIDVYTDWCGWCKHMIRTTYSDPNLAGYINAYFYPVKFNAETKDTIEYNGVKYVNESGKPKSTHQLAHKLLGTSLTYPSTIFVNNNFQFNLLTQGYLDVKKIEPILIYTLENIFRTTSFDDFNVMFGRTFYDSLKSNQPERVKWYSWREAQSLQKKKPKKIIAAIGTNWCSGCKVMIKSSFCDSLVADYINKNYYLVEINAESRDTMNLSGKDYYGSSDPRSPFHSIVPVLTRNSFVLPSIVFLDEKQTVIESIPFYQHPKGLDPVLKYFGENSYQKMKWDEFIKSYQEQKKSKNDSKVKASGKK